MLFFIFYSVFHSAEYLRNKTEGVIGRGSSKEFEDAFDFDTSSLDGEAAEGMIGSGKSFRILNINKKILLE